MTFLERTLLLIEKNGITKNKLLTDLKMSKNSFVAWENRGTVPSGDTVVKIANYFNVSTDYLLGKTDEPSPASAPADASSLTDNEQSLITNYRSLDEPQQTNVFNYVSDLAKLNQWNVQKINGGIALTTREHEIPESVIEKAKKLK